MKSKIEFIKWKNLLTKSINDLVVGWWFECDIKLYEQLHKQVGAVLKLHMEYNWAIEIVDCMICTDTKTYLQFVDDHWIVRLDIIIKDILLSWFIIKADLYLELSTKDDTNLM